MRQAREASIFLRKQTILRAKRASPPQELSKLGAERQFFASPLEMRLVSKFFSLERLIVGGPSDLGFDPCNNHMDILKSHVGNLYC